MTIAEILLVAPQATDVLKRLGINCEDTKTKIEYACQEAKVPLQVVKNGLKKINAKSYTHPESAMWPIQLLTDQMMGRHHFYIKELISGIRKSIDKVTNQYGSIRIELKKVEYLFSRVVAGMEQHLYTEEKILFPVILKLAHKTEKTPDKKYNEFHLMHPIEVMENEHETIIADLNKIKILSHGYKVPKGTNVTYQLLYDQLHQLEKYMKYIIQLENRVLFPAAIQLEKDVGIIPNSLHH